MDDLEDSAARHCSHLSRTVRDHIANMVNVLVSLGDEIPSAPSERFSSYKKHGIPEAVYLQYDGEATAKALKKIVNG